MCFSASASLGAGAVLGVIGVVSLTQSKKSSQIAFASIPLLFSVQQFSEGALWLSLPNPADATLQHIATYVFLFFAQVVWPLLVPVSIVLLERENKYKTLLLVFAGAGAVVSVYLAYCLLTFPVQANIIGYHIAYAQDYPTTFKYIGRALYGIATIAPLFFSDVKRMWLLGLTILTSYLISWMFYDHYLLSVWCFFASVISIGVLLIIRSIRHSAHYLRIELS